MDYRNDGIISSFETLARWLVTSNFTGLKDGALEIKDDFSPACALGNSKAGEPSACLQVHERYFWVRVLLSGDIGFAQSFMLGDISTPDLTGVFEFFIRNTASIGWMTGSGATALARNLIWNITRMSNGIGNAKLHGIAHYSLSNDMFAAFLSPDMTYSAPLWLNPSDPGASEDTLETAQLRKLRYAMSAARIKSTDHVLEIGTGWGSFAIEAVRTTGCRVTTVTVSAAQKELADQRIAQSGFADRIEVLLADYRELRPTQPYDKIVSIEMIEHVGHGFLATYFSCMDRYLKADGGVAYFQCITIPEARYVAYRGSEDFIKKYIFPGGHLPTVSGLVSSIDRGSGSRLVVEEIKQFGGHYSKALRCWRENFLRNFDDQIAPALQAKHPNMAKAELEVFKRKWVYYFCYCEAGFKTKTLGDVGITVAREGCVELLDNVS